MASVTVTLDPVLLEAVRAEAVRRRTSVEQMAAAYFTSVAQESERSSSTENLIRLMNEGVLGAIDRRMSRDEMYAERTWPRS